MARIAKSEKAVRLYLDRLQGIVDQEQIDLIEAKIAAESDTIAKLKLLSNKARLIDPNECLPGFIENVKDYAERNGIVPEAFLAMNVPRSALEEAGLVDAPAKVAREYRRR